MSMIHPLPTSGETKETPQEIDPVENLIQKEKELINDISFVPDESVREIIYEQAKAAITKPELRSKLEKKHRYADPREGLLYKIATQTAPFPTPKPAVENYTFAMIRDNGLPPLLTEGVEKGSNGMNGIMVGFREENRMNLFYRDDEATRLVLNDYLRFRNRNRHAIFEETLQHMEESTDYEEYVRATRLLRALQPDFDRTIGVVSFCQTWASEQNHGAPQFSMNTPHFQTRFYIKALPVDITRDIQTFETLLESYTNVVSKFHTRMTTLKYVEYIVELGKYKKDAKFVNLDGLADVLNSRGETKS